MKDVMFSRLRTDFCTQRSGSCAALAGLVVLSVAKYLNTGFNKVNFNYLNIFQILRVHRVQEKSRPKCFCHIFYKTRPILIKGGTQYSE